MTPGQTAVVTIILSVLAVILIPMLALLIRIIIKWTRIEDKLSALTEDMKELVEAKEKVHNEMFKTMSEDRKATDRRLRYLEEKVWGRNAL